MSSINKRKEGVTSEEIPPTKKLSRQARARRNKKQRHEQEQIEISNESDNIVFNPNRHRTQNATRGLCTHDKVDYIKKEWLSVPLSLSDRKSSKEIKTRQEISNKDLLIETLIREARSVDNTSLNLIEIPSDFLALLETDIINTLNNDTTTPVSTYNENNDQWIDFGRFLGFEEPIKRRDVRRHLKNRWGKLQHAFDIQNNKELQGLSETAIERNTRKEKARLIVSAHNNLQSLDMISQFRYINNPECVTDRYGQTLFHLELLNNPTAITQATDAVNHYYLHTLDHPSHRSESFWKNFIEHFGVFALNNFLPYTSSNSASCHNIDHLECVNKLIHGLESLSISINWFLQKYYKSLYEKLSKLKWGSFGPRSFGVFPMIAVNFNTVSDYHWDEHDEPNSLCCLVALGEFEGGELCFPQLQIIVPLRPGQVVAFSSRLLLHGNFPVTKGIRHSIVYFVHASFFHNLRDFSSVYSDLKDGVERDARGSIVSMIPRQDLNDARNLNKPIRLSQPKKSQTEVPEKSCDKRRGNIDLSRARRGLKAEDPLPDGI